MGRKNRRRANRQVSKRRGLFARGVVIGGRRRAITQFGWELPGAAHAVVDLKYHGKSVNNPTVEAEWIVPLDGRCQNRLRGKRGFLSEEKAKRALRVAQQWRQQTKSAKQERNFYRCEKPGCRFYHLTTDGRDVNP